MITIRELKKQYGKTVALDNVCFEVKDSVIFGLVGPNGAGKSTIINILTGIIKKTSGTVSILGFDIDKETKEIKKKMGVIPEMSALFEGLTGWEHLVFVSEIFDLERDIYNKKIMELLEYFDIYKEKDRLISTYSQGMKRKLSFISAIIHDPDILFLDEPFENVDPVSRKKMKDVLKKMQEKGTDIFITSHALAEVENFCDEVAIINKGKIVYQSKTKDIRKEIKNSITNETYQSLEEIFLDLTTDVDNTKEMTWL